VAVAVKLGLDSRDYLIGRATDTRDLKAIREEIENTAGVDELLDLRTMHVGPDHLIVAAWVGFSDEISADRAEDVAGEIDRRLVSRLPQLSHVFLKPIPARTKAPRTRSRAIPDLLPDYWEPASLGMDCLLSRPLGELVKLGPGLGFGAAGPLAPATAAPCWPSAVRVCSDMCAIVFFDLAASCALVTFFSAALVCFAVAIGASWWVFASTLDCVALMERPNFPIRISPNGLGRSLSGSGSCTRRRKRGFSACDHG
jgi:hypothetical protein